MICTTNIDVSPLVRIYVQGYCRWSDIGERIIEQSTAQTLALENDYCAHEQAHRALCRCDTLNPSTRSSNFAQYETSRRSSSHLSSHSFGTLSLFPQANVHLVQLTKRQASLAESYALVSRSFGIGGDSGQFAHWHPPAHLDIDRISPTNSTRRRSISSRHCPKSTE